MFVDEVAGLEHRSAGIRRGLIVRLQERRWNEEQRCHREDGADDEAGVLFDPAEEGFGSHGVLRLLRECPRATLVVDSVDIG